MMVMTTMTIMMNSQNNKNDGSDDDGDIIDDGVYDYNDGDKHPDGR